MIKSICKDCKGSQLCKHDQVRYICKQCNGKGICVHDIRKIVCKICDPISHLLSLQRRRINYILKEQKIQKDKTTLEYLGCTSKFLYDHIQNQLTGEMKIHGYEIDHIKPIAKFDLTNIEELYKCCHWSNLQPLLIKDNRHKSDKWTEYDENIWKQNN